MPLKIFFLGIPGSGKSTAGKTVAESLNLYYINTGQTIRDIVSLNEPKSLELKFYLSKGQQPPAALLKEVILENNIKRNLLAKENGFILDGYPLKSPEYIQDLCDPEICFDHVFIFNCSDETSAQRQSLRNERQSDSIEKARKRVADYRSKYEGSSLDPEYIQRIFPNSQIHVINTECDKKTVAKEIMKAFLVFVK